LCHYCLGGLDENSTLCRGDIVKYGLVDGNAIKGLKYSPFSSLGAAFETDGSTYKTDEVKLLAPCVPSKLVCIGLNYKATSLRALASRLNFHLFS